MESKNIGWIGTGVMGKSMCLHLINSGNTAYIYNRTKQKAAELLEKGASWCDSPEEVAEKSEIIFSIVGFPEDVEKIILDEKGVLKGAKQGSVIVDMTTSSPILAKKIYEICKNKGIYSLDAPVSGGDIGAREGKLAIMVGGDRDVYDKALPFFKIMGENIAYMGKAGAGQHTKMSNQILIAGTMIGVVESLLYAYKTGMNLDSVIDVIGKGAASSWSINNLGKRIAKGDFDPGFFIKHFIKDMGIALDEAKRINLALPGLSLVHQFYIAASSLGYENLGTQGLYKVFQKMNNI
ncbi:MAG: NAD(P)-dependent oxidoreductase [Deltaproteobacteria bacterium]|nr:NAD(P)-dependent oxidoreductase [Deltaproteobacteria bacterium]